MTPAQLERSTPEILLRSDGPARLLAVRLAGGPFAPPFDVRTPSFEDLLVERRERHRALAELREGLVEALFQAVPSAPDREARRRLLDAKRRIFNGLPLAATDHSLAPHLLALLDRYRELTAQEETCYEAARDSILREIRTQLRAVWADLRFRLACRFVSPDLAGELAKKGFPDAGELTSIERGLYAFASRWTSKANPFHLFAEVAFPPALGIAVDGDHEIVLEAADLLAIESRLLPLVSDPQQIHLTLSPFQRLAESLIFWVPARPGFRCVGRSAGDPVLEAAIDFFAAQRRRNGWPTGTLAEWLTAGAGSEESLAELCREGVVEQYLIADFDRFAESLLGIDAKLDPFLENLGAHHLSRLSTAALEVASAAIPLHFYVNSYRRLELESFETAAAEIAPALRALKPFFARDHNFSRHSYVIESYLLDHLAHLRRDQARYLDILRHFLRHHQEIIPRYQPEAHRTAAEQGRRAHQADLLRRLSGRREIAALQDLELPGADGGGSLCFNGPFDFGERIFFVSNVFAGAGRFAGRYLLQRRRGEEGCAGDGYLHVELAVPPTPNLNYVVRRFAVGCGFEARYAKKYEQWIDPAEILVVREGAGIAYRDAVSGKTLRFHYSGFQLATLLPSEYQLLLVGHADSFQNPFLRDDRELYDPGLQVGPVCLRRENWSVGGDFWGDLAAERNSIRFAACLRDLVRDRLSPNDLWYYRRPEGGREHHKPRFLDLRNPLSAHAFQREIARLPAGELLSLSPMRPAPERVTELMIEV